MKTCTKGPSGNKVCILARAPGGQMRGAATQAMPVCIVEERQQSRYAPFAAAPLRAAARRPAGGVARSLHTAAGMLVARALPAGLGPAAKCTPYFLTGPKPAAAKTSCFTTETRVVRKNRSAGVSPASEPRQLLLGQHDLCRLEAGDTFFLTTTEYAEPHGERYF